MDLEEIKQRKTALENLIQMLISNFESETDVSVGNVNLEYMYTVGSWGSSVSKVNVEIKI